MRKGSCTKCGKGPRANGGTSLCKRCRSIHRKEQHAKDPRQSLVQAAKTRAKRLGVPCTLHFTDLVVPDICPVLGIPLRPSRKPQTDNSPSLDRLRPELGYVQGNAVVMSLRANRIKNNSSPEELRRVAAWLQGEL